MNLPELSIRRPVLACMLSAIFIIFGVISYFRIGIQENPNITFPTITVTTNLPGGNPSVIDEMITKPIEGIINTIAGVKQISSSSSPGKSSVEIEFKLGTDMNVAFNEIQSKLNQIKGEMPTDTKPFVITKASVGSDPIMLLAISGNRTLEQLSDVANSVVKRKLENVPGVAEVEVEGVVPEVVRVNLNIAKMAAMGIALDEVQNAFSEQHVQIPGGYITAGSKQYSLNLNLEFHQVDELEHMIVAYRQGAPIFLKDVATIDLGLPSQQQMALFNGKVAVGVSITKKSGTNTVSIVKEVQSRINHEVKPLLPSGVKIGVVFEEAQYILDIIHELEQDAWLSILTAGIIIWLFLKSLRSTFIVMTAIPVSLLGVVMVIYFAGYTFNIVTLLGIIVLVGVVVDDAIVVLENIDRHMHEKNVKRIDAAISGSGQVMFAVLASSLTLVSIFLPVVFMGGIVGLFFRSFAIVVATGVVISLFVSLTLTPMLCSRFLSIVTSQRRVYRVLENGFVFMDQGYRKVLQFSLNFRWLIILATIIIVLSSAPIFYVIGKAFLPSDLNSGHFSITIQTPQGSSIDYTKDRIAKAESILAMYPEIEQIFSSIGPVNQGTITVRLVPQNRRKMQQVPLVQTIQKQLRRIPGVQCFVNNSTQGASLTFEVQGPEYNGAVENASKLLNALEKHPELGSIYIYLSLNQPQYQLTLDRILSQSIGLSARSVGSALMVLGGGVKVAKFNKTGGSKRYDVVLRTQPGDFIKPQDVSRIYLRNSAGKLVRLDTVASLKTALAPVEITRTDLNYSVALSTSPTISMDKAIQLIQSVSKNTLSKGYRMHLTGSTAALGQTAHQAAFTLLLIMLLIYMVLASQFNSFIQPFIIMVAQPLAIIGGLLILWLTNQTLNIYSMIGMLLLMGLVAKNSILLIDLTNQFREKGQPIKEALLDACPQRMRPVVMTSLSIILAMIPAAIIGGVNASTHRPMALVIIGGMVSSTILTLIVVPALYSLVENGLQRFKKPDEPVDNKIE